MVPERDDEENIYAWRREERGESNATRAARETLLARIRQAESDAEREEGGGARRRRGDYLGRPLPGVGPIISLERRVVNVYEERAAEEAGRHPRLV